MKSGFFNHHPGFHIDILDQKKLLIHVTEADFIMISRHTQSPSLSSKYASPVGNLQDMPTLSSIRYPS
jgi:hypothetical protein